MGSLRIRWPYGLALTTRWSCESKSANEFLASIRCSGSPTHSMPTSGRSSQKPPREEAVKDTELPSLSLTAAKIDRLQVPLQTWYVGVRQTAKDDFAAQQRDTGSRTCSGSAPDFALFPPATGHR